MYLLFFIQQLSWTNWLWCSNPFVCEVTGSWSFWGMKDFLWFPGLWIVFLGLLVASGDFVLNAVAPFDNILHKSADSNMILIFIQSFIATNVTFHAHFWVMPQYSNHQVVIGERHYSLVISFWNNCTILQECQTKIINCHVFHCGYKICY